MKLFLIMLVIFLLFSCDSNGQVVVVSSNNGSPNIKGHAINMPLGQYILVRDGENHAAIKLTSATSTGDGGVNYDWYFQSDNSGSFTNENAKSGQGEVFEQYKKSAINSVENDGGILVMKCGTINVEWSLSNWIYYGMSHGGLLLCPVDEREIGDIDFLNNDLVWYSKKD